MTISCYDISFLTDCLENHLGKQLFRLFYDAQHDDDPEDSEETVDWVTLKERVRTYRTFIEEKEKMAIKERRIQRAQGIKICEYCAEDHDPNEYLEFFHPDIDDNALDLFEDAERVMSEVAETDY